MYASFMPAIPEDSLEYAQHMHPALTQTVLNEWDEFKKLKARDFTDRMITAKLWMLEGYLILKGFKVYVWSRLA